MLTKTDPDDAGRIIGRGRRAGSITLPCMIGTSAVLRCTLFAAALIIAMSVASISGPPAMASEHVSEAVFPEAQALPARTATHPEKPVALRTSFISETRLGLLAQDPWSPEAQSTALHGEVLFARPFAPSDPLMRYFTPQPHIGASFNLGSRTSFIFAGLSWNIDLSPRVFVEASFGGALHDGHRGGVLRNDRAALGCAPLFRESASLGYRFSERLSLMATVEHYGNAGLCAENRGLTNIGARFGYSF